MKIEDKKMNPVPPLQVGDGKEKPKIKLDWSFKGLKDWFLGITINF